MRGMHGGREQGAGPKKREEMTLDELRAERDTLNEEIGQRAEQSTSGGTNTLLGYSRVQSIEGSGR